MTVDISRGRRHSNMNPMSRLLIATLFIVIWMDTAFALNCYNCYSFVHDGCGENVNHATLLANGNILNGCSACMKTFQFLGTAFYKIERTCGGIGDSCTSILGNGACTCTTDFCNGQNSTRKPPVVLICSFSIFILMLYIHRII